jgi:hypothetical protein
VAEFQDLSRYWPGELRKFTDIRIDDGRSAHSTATLVFNIIFSCAPWASHHIIRRKLWDGSDISATGHRHSSVEILTDCGLEGRG